MIAVLLLITTAFADIAPEDDYVEECTMENMIDGGSECESCTNSMEENQNSEACAALEEQGHIKQCQTYGASFWTEIWCAEGKGFDTTKKETETGCNAAGVAALISPLLIALIGLRRRERPEE